MMTTLREDAKYSQSLSKMKNCPRYGCRRLAAIQAQNVPLVWPHSSTPLFRIQIRHWYGKGASPNKKSGHQSRHLKCSMISVRRFFLLDKYSRSFCLSLSYN